jgi:hypothetical protein
VSPRGELGVRRVKGKKEVTLSNGEGKGNGEKRGKRKGGEEVAASGFMQERGRLRPRARFRVESSRAQRSAWLGHTGQHDRHGV